MAMVFKWLFQNIMFLEKFSKCHCHEWYQCNSNRQSLFDSATGIPPISAKVIDLVDTIQAIGQGGSHLRIETATKGAGIALDC